MKYLYCILPLFIINCIPYQINNVNSQADQANQNLDQQCKDNMTDWCKMQYQHVENWRTEQLVNIENQREAYANAFKPAETTNCTSHKTYNGDIETTCNH